MSIRISNPNRVDRLQDTSGLTALNTGDILYYSGTDWVHFDRPGGAGTYRLRNTAGGLISWALDDAVTPNAFTTFVPDIGTNLTAGTNDTATFTSDSSTINISGTGADDELVFDVDTTHNFEWTGSHMWDENIYTSGTFVSRNTTSALSIADNSFAFNLEGDVDTGVFFSNTRAAVEFAFGGVADHQFFVGAANAKGVWKPTLRTNDPSSASADVKGAVMVKSISSGDAKLYINTDGTNWVVVGTQT